MKSFKHFILLSLLPLFMLRACNTHDLYKVGENKNGKLVIGGSEFKITLEQDKKGSPIEVTNQAFLRLKELPIPFPRLEDDIDFEYYTYKPTHEGNPSCPDREIAYRIGKQGKNNLSISDDQCIVGLTGKKYFVYPLPQRNRNFDLCPSDDEAYCVSQGNVCYATNKKMGTRNVQDCVALIMRDKKSGKTALAHVPEGLAQFLVNDTLDYMPKGPKEVILVGGQHTLGEHNLKDILERLLSYNDTIDIVQAYCGNTGYLLSRDPGAREIIMTSFYHINTNFGNVIVDPKNLKITTDRPKLEIPSHCRIQYGHDDLDKL